MTVTLLHNTPLEIADLAIGKCWDKPSKGAGHMIERIERVGNKNKHASTLEHINYTFDIDGISRACLQELARHRHQSLSVKSTRYTLKELKTAEIQTPAGNINLDVVSKFCVLPKHYDMSIAIGLTLLGTQDFLRRGIANDIVKYTIPEAYKTSLVSTFNMRSLQNFLTLRTSKAALGEIRELAQAMYEATPDNHKFMFAEFINKETEK